MSKEHEDTIARLMLEINRLHGDISTLAQEHTSMRARNERLEAELEKAHEQIAELDVHAQTVKKLTNRKELLKFLLDGNTWEEYEKWKANEKV